MKLKDNILEIKPIYGIPNNLMLTHFLWWVGGGGFEELSGDISTGENPRYIPLALVMNHDYDLSEIMRSAAVVCWEKLKGC